MRPALNIRGAIEVYKAASKVVKRPFCSKWFAGLYSKPMKWMPIE